MGARKEMLESGRGAYGAETQSDQERQTQGCPHPVHPSHLPIPSHIVSLARPWREPRLGGHEASGAE